MSSAKYKQYFNDMFEANKEDFQRFMLLCNDYRADKQKYKAQFDQEGEKIVEVVKHWENLLCAKMERGSKSAYSSTLSDKFWGEVRAYFPCIDEVGVKIGHI